jgi:hypothetical protein
MARYLCWNKLKKKTVKLKTNNQRKTHEKDSNCRRICHDNGKPYGL